MDINSLYLLSPRNVVLNEDVSPELRNRLLHMLFIALAIQRSYEESLNMWREVKGSVDPNYSAKISKLSSDLRKTVSQSKEGSERLAIFYGKPVRIRFITNDEFVRYLEGMVTAGKLSPEKFNDYMAKLKMGKEFLGAQPVQKESLDSDLRGIYDICLTEEENQYSIKTILNYLEIPNKKDLEKKLKMGGWDVDQPIEMAGLNSIVRTIESDLEVSKIAKKIGRWVKLGIDKAKEEISKEPEERKQALYSLISRITPHKISGVRMRQAKSPVVKEPESEPGVIKPVGATQ